MELPKTLQETAQLLNYVAKVGFLQCCSNDFGLTTLKPQIFDVASLVRLAGMQQQRKLQIIITVAHCLLLAVGRLLHTPCLRS